MITPAGMRLAVPVVAAIFTIPSWHQTLVEHDTSVQSAMVRYVVALPLAWVLLSFFQKAAHVPAPEASAEFAGVEFAELANGAEVPVAGGAVVSQPVPQEQH
jgi:hypothetical protein